MYSHSLFFQPAFFPGLLFGSFIGLAFLALAAWIIVWKGLALWHAARNGQKGWFVALLLINTLGILEIVYLVWFRTKDPFTPSLFSSASPKSSSEEKPE